MPKPFVTRVAKCRGLLGQRACQGQPSEHGRACLEESLQVIGGPFLLESIFHPLGSNIQHILEAIEFDLEDSVGMKGDNMGPLLLRMGMRAQPNLCLRFQR
jgi:hypothetical protein